MLLTHPSSHLHKLVQWTPALQHLQFPVHDFIHLHCRRMEQALLLSSRVVQNYTTHHCCPCATPSHRSWGCPGGQMLPDSRTVLWLCWYKAVCVHGKACSAFFPLVKSLTSVTLSRPQPLLHMTTTKHSRVCVCWDCEPSSWGSLVRTTRVYISPSVLC